MEKLINVYLELLPIVRGCDAVVMLDPRHRHIEIKRHAIGGSLISTIIPILKKQQGLSWVVGSNRAYWVELLIF